LTLLRSDGAAAATVAYFPLNQIVPRQDLLAMGGGVSSFDVKFNLADADQDTVTAVTVYTINDVAGVPTATALSTDLYSVAGYLNGSSTASAANVIGIATGSWKIVVTFSPVLNLTSYDEVYVLVDNDPAATTNLAYTQASVTV
jgi:hypothetical protein